MHKGPVTVIASDYGTRLDNQLLSRSATVDGVPDFVNLYEYDNRDRWIARSHDPDGDGPLGFTDTYFVYDCTPPSGSLLDRAAVTMENIGQIVLHFESDGQGDPQLAHRYLWGPAVDQILADEQVTDPTAPGNVVWPLTDHLNTVRDLAAYDADTDTVLAQGESSRLAQRLKFEQPLVLSVGSASYTPHFAPGLFAIFASAQRHTWEKASDEIVRAVERLREELVTPEELAKAKKQKAAELVYQ